MEEADGEPDREFVEADREPECDKRQPVAGGEALKRGSFRSFVLDQHPGAKHDQDRAGDVAGRVADEMSEPVTDEDTDQRHRGLERGEQQAHA